MKKKQLYIWHRWLSVLCLLPVMMWCFSGLMHPMMAHFFKVSPAQMFLKQQPFEADLAMVSIKDLPLPKGNIQDIRFARIANKPYYQIQVNDEWKYYDWHNGEELEHGDEVYARHLAQYFLGDSTSAISSIEIVEKYTAQYKIINRLLPVYKVAFDREDGIEVYVHTGSARLGTLNDDMRKGFLWVFSMFHNWDFLGDDSNLKRVVVLLFSTLVFITGVMGLVIFFTTKRLSESNARMKPRRRHRKLAVAVSIVLLMFSFSGAYHALQKIEPYNLNGHGPSPLKVNLDDLVNEPLDAMLKVVAPFKQISLKELQDELYYRFEPAQFGSEAIYTSVEGLELLDNGDFAYARERAEAIAGQSFELIEEPVAISKFTRAYGFINKRLPVVQIAFDTPDHLTCFIEPSSGIPGAIVRDKNRAEIVSFLFLHKYHFLDFLGKGLRDTIMSLAALSLVVIALSGLWILIKK
ncbi:MAG: PepSY domain-containing protein [Reichenbachiella sp.]|uniref:PepSY domain-containing protein n=1 Tax=Reichenbachiella sp. TaxID=2184521 RepID=UPI0029672844|nr:PepSY domain-containing protein [Reichenbachiella sp.]MDW3211884.1 PepSY domain-containing protein [Reichenbachiella sp.]